MAVKSIRAEVADPLDLTSGGVPFSRHSIRDRHAYIPRDSLLAATIPRSASSAKASAATRVPSKHEAASFTEELASLHAGATRGTTPLLTSALDPAYPLNLTAAAPEMTAHVALDPPSVSHISIVTRKLDEPDAEEVAEQSQASWLATVIKANQLITPKLINSFIGGLTVIVVAATLPGAWILAAALAIGLCTISQSSARSRELQTMLLAATVGFTSVDYLTWRFEVSNWAGWWIAAPLLAAEVFGALHTLGLQYTLWPRSEPALSRTCAPASMPIYILIPTVNEGPEILTGTILAARETCREYAQAYPDAYMYIVICNDGYVAKAPNWRETEALARRLKVNCVTRTQGGGAKAGNIEYTRQLIGARGDSLIVIFDADQRPRPDFLLKTIPPFADPSLGWVQTGQYYSNVQQPVAAWANDQQALFYRLLCPGKATQNAAFICGTNVALRAAALDEIGGLPQDSVTEDFAASIKLHGRWRSIFVPGELATGLGPMDMPSYLRQQRRWAIGTLSVLRTNWPEIFLPWVGQLTFAQRIQYALACTHYLSGLRDLIYILAPIAFIATGIPAVRGASLAIFVWHFLPYLIASQAAFWYAARRQTGLRGIIMGFGSFPVLLDSLLVVLLGRRSGFTVTAKRRNAKRSWMNLLPYVGFLLLCAIGLSLGFTATGRRHDAVAISMLWIAYSASMLAGFLWLALRDLLYRESPAHLRHKAILEHWERAAMLWLKGAIGRSYTPQVGYSLLSLSLLIGGVAVTVREVSRPAAPIVATFSPSVGKQSHPYLGMSVQAAMLNATPASMNNALCEPFTIVGQTHYAQEEFPTAWANRLATQHAQPWIVLEFGKFGADGKPPLTASLLAIANGVQDSNIRRWADEIRAYGKPVYLTILLHVDRNWSVSSAVANGGIPQDAARAWLHTQAIFRAEGANNVAWVWAPADPAHDQPYAPPEQSISIVLQSFLRYSGTPWPDVSRILAEDSQRYPGKPLFVEVSAAGAPQEKSAWLNSVRSSVAAYHDVYALLYHDGSPDLRASAADNQQWSYASDPLSIRSIASWRSLIQSSQLTC